MENTQNNMADHSSSDNKKTVLITVMTGVIVLGVLIWWMRQPQATQQSVVSPTPTSDTESAAINQDLEGIDVGDLNAEFNAIDFDLQGL